MRWFGWIGAAVVLTGVTGWGAHALADTIWDYEAVDADGYGTHPLVGANPYDGDGAPTQNMVTIEGMVIGGTGDLVDRSVPGYGAYPFAMYSIWIQDDNAEKGGIQCWAGAGYWWDREPVWRSWPDINAGSRVEVTGWLANYNGKVFINDRHDNELMWTVTVLDPNVGMPTPEVIGSIGAANYFDQTRTAGGERWQTRWVKFENVEIVGGAENWGANGEVIISDTGGDDNLIMKLSLMGDFDSYSAPTGPFDVVGVFDQEDDDADPYYHDGYRLWVKNYGDITPVPEPATGVLLFAGAAGLSILRRRR